MVTQHAIDEPVPSKFLRGEMSSSDRDLAERLSRAVVELQEVMDSCLLAGLIVEPNFAKVANRLTRFGTRIDSSVCNVRVFRKLT